MSAGEQALSGKLYQIKYTINQPPIITTHPAIKLGAATKSVTFTASASGENPLNY